MSHYGFDIIAAIFPDWKAFSVCGLAYRCSVEVELAAWRLGAHICGCHTWKPHWNHLGTSSPLEEGVLAGKGHWNMYLTWLFRPVSFVLRLRHFITPSRSWRGLLAGSKRCLREGFRWSNGARRHPAIVLVDRRNCNRVEVKLLLVMGG